MHNDIYREMCLGTAFSNIICIKGIISIRRYIIRV